MIGIEIDAKQLKRLREATGRAKKNFSKELAAAINETAKDVRLKISRDISSEITMPVKDIKSRISTKQKATAQTPIAVASLGWKKREGLQYFKARQTKAGVTYRISKKAKRGLVLGAFMGPSPGVLALSLNGGVFVRMGAARKMTKGRSQGKIRQPIVKLRAVSAAGAFLKNKHDKVMPGFIRQKLTHQMERRINKNVLQAEGLIPK
jgi:hypothetical protein